MKASDLMIGDFVVNTEFGKNDIDKIETLEPRRVWLEHGKTYVPIDYIEPIPLTREILEKNGFGKGLDEDNIECYRYYSSAADGYIKITLYDGYDGDWGIEIINYEKFDGNEIVYKNNFIFLKVHQLQHALRLCGIKKEIVL